MSYQYTQELNDFIYRFQISKEEFESWVEINPEKTFDEYLDEHYSNKINNSKESAQDEQALYEGIKEVYLGYAYYKAYVQNDIKEGANFLRGFFKYDLLKYRSTNLKANIIVIGSQDCKKCANSKLKRTLEYEIKHQRLPFADCPMIGENYKLCKAVYACEVKRDENGLPISASKVNQEKQYNLNTQYGRRKWREQARLEYENLSPNEKRERNIYGIVIMIIICLIIWALLGTKGFLKWTQR